MERTTIILTGGGPGPPADTLPEAGLVIAADSGLQLAAGLELEVNLIVGDLDSARPQAVRRAQREGAILEEHPAAKDATDLELALEAAVARQAERVVIVGGGEGRLDHLLGIAQMVGDERWRTIDIEWHTAHAVAYRVDGDCMIATDPGDLISLLPATSSAVVSISGTRWELSAERLTRGSSRGLSNEALGSSVAITITEGIVLAVHTRGDS